VERERRTVPLSWIVSSLGVFAIVIVMVIVIVNALGG
jgi:hypothetical protein